MTSADPSIRAAAHAYAQRGWFPLALHGVVDLPDGGTACTCKKGPSCPKATQGKHPIAFDWTTQNAPDMGLFERGLPTNVGIVTGVKSGIFVVDIDTNEGMINLQAMGKLTPTYMVQTGGRGWQLYYQMPAGIDITNRDKTLPKGVDVRGNGGMVVAPPSRSGKGPYRTHMNTQPQPAPAWLIEALTPREAVPVPPAAQRIAMPEGDLHQTNRQRKLEEAVVEGEVKRLTDLDRPWHEGARWDATTYEVACQLVELANADWTRLTLEEARMLVTEHAPADGQWNEAVTKFESAVRSVGDKARPSPDGRADALDPFSAAYVPPQGHTAAATGVVEPDGTWPRRTLDDLGGAQRMVDHFHGELRWVDEADTWAVYKGGRWQLGSKVVGQRYVHLMIDRLEDTEAHSWSAEKANPDNAKELSPRDMFSAYVKKLRMSSRIEAVLKQAKSMPEFAAGMTDFDRWPMYLNCANGIVDMNTGALLPHDPNALMMHQCPVDYDPNAQAPIWDSFLRRVMPNPDMVDYLQRIVGYSLTGETGEQAMFIHHGTGANGKSVFLSVISAITGDYGQVVPRETLLTKGQGSEHPTSIARMVGKRFLQTSETAAGRRLDEEVIKGLTGGEMQTARYMNRDFFDFKPTGKIHYVTNHLPRLTDAESIWRRLHLVGWRVTIPEHERDIRLADDIAEKEGPGVLAWAIRGTIAWRQRRLVAPIMAKADRDAYRADQDEFARYLDQRVIVKSGERTNVETLFGTYTAWATSARVRNPLTQSDFIRTLRERGFETMTQNRIVYIAGMAPAAYNQDLGVFGG